MKQHYKPSKRQSPLHQAEQARRLTIMRGLKLTSEELAVCAAKCSHTDPKLLEMETARVAMMELYAAFEKYDKMHNATIHRIMLNAPLRKLFISKSIVMLADVISRPLVELETIASTLTPLKPLPTHLLLFHKYAQHAVPAQPQTWFSV